MKVKPDTLKTALQKLNNINIQDIKNVLSSTYIKDFLLKNLNVLTNILLIIISLALLITFSVATNNEMKTIKAQVPLLEKKIEKYTAYQNTTKELAEYLKNFPEPVESNTFIDQLSTFALNNAVTIKSISPSRKIENKLYYYTRYRIVVYSSDYRSLVKFMHDIEYAGFPMRIDTMSATVELRAQPGQIGKNLEDVLINIIIELGLVELKK